VGGVMVFVYIALGAIAAFVLFAVLLEVLDR
jgi:hypothetical protein